MQIMLQKNEEGKLEPLSGYDEGLIEKIPVGKGLRAVIKRPRNPINHSRAMALFQVVLQNNDKFRNMDDVINTMKIELGYVDPYIKASGEIVYVLKSISFDSMGEDAFQEFKSKAIDIIIEKYLWGTTPEDLDNAARQIIGFL